MFRSFLRASLLPLAFASILAFGPGCAFQSTARQWNKTADPEGKPLFYKSITKVGINFLVFIPFMGDMSIDGLVDDLTKYIEEEEGDGVRLVQGASENYWYGYPPLTWIITPIISSVSAEYEPSEEEIAKQEKAEAEGHVEPRWYKPWSW